MDDKCMDEPNAFESVCSLFHNLRAKDRQLMRKHFACTTYRKGEFIFHDGDPPGGLICLIRGNVKIYKEGVSGRDQIVRLTKPLGFIGYRALFSGENHNSHAQALEDCLVGTIERECMTKILRSNAELTYHILQSVSTELGIHTSRTVTLTQKHIRGRLAEALISLRETYGVEDDGCTIRVSLSREDLASLSNMTTSNAIRTLSAFANEQVIALDGRRIMIVDAYQLERISELG